VGYAEAVPDVYASMKDFNYPSPEEITRLVAARYASRVKFALIVSEDGKSLTFLPDGDQTVTVSARHGVEFPAGTVITTIEGTVEELTKGVAAARANPAAPTIPR
jgi:hypothetical protein